jgi:hypothetical protein
MFFAPREGTANFDMEIVDFRCESDNSRSPFNNDKPMKSKLTSILILVITLTVLSCKKDHTCTCNITWTNTNEQVGGTIITSGSYTETRVARKQTKRQAEAGSCASSDVKKVESTNPGTATEETKTVCSLD